MANIPEVSTKAPTSVLVNCWMDLCLIIDGRSVIMAAKRIRTGRRSMVLFGAVTERLCEWS